MHSSARPSAGHADEAGRRGRSMLHGVPPHSACSPCDLTRRQQRGAARAARVQMKLVEGESVLIFDGASVCPAVPAHPRIRTHGVRHEMSSRAIQ